jgi:quercetin 2,3-dioxygenase
LVTPKAFHAFAKEVPEFKDEKAWVRVVQGNFQNLQSPIELLTSTTLLDVNLQPHATLSFDAQAMAFVYLISGSILIDGKAVAATSLISFEKEGSQITISTGDSAANFMYASGAPHNEPIVHGGAFVMTTNEQMLAAKGRLQRGEMGILNPL